MPPPGGIFNCPGASALQAEYFDMNYLQQI
jgi:hypothetical protein